MHPMSERRLIVITKWLGDKNYLTLVRLRTFHAVLLLLVLPCPIENEAEARVVDGRCPWIFHKNAPRIYVYGHNILKKGNKDQSLSAEIENQLKMMNLSARATGSKSKPEMMKPALRKANAVAIWKAQHQSKKRKYRYICPSCKAVIKPERQLCEETEHSQSEPSQK